MALQRKSFAAESDDLNLSPQTNMAGRREPAPTSCLHLLLQINNKKLKPQNCIEHSHQDFLILCLRSLAGC